MIFFDEVEFKTFYLSNFSGLRTYLYAKCKDIDLAEDMAQEALLRLWNNMAKVEKVKAKAFVFTTANNLFLDHIRHEKVKTNYKSGINLIQDNKDPHFYLQENEFRIKLEQTIENMPELSREVFLMSRMEKMTYQQIAESLNLSVKAIEKRMQKALEIMATLKLKI